MSSTTPPRSSRRGDELDAYLEDLIAQRRESLTDDLISDLIRAEDDKDEYRLTHDELVMLCGTLLGAGTDTTRNQLAAAVGALCAHPDQWALLAAHPELAPAAVDELMRYRPIIFGTIRRASENVELAGVRIPGRHPGGRQHCHSQSRSAQLRRPGPARHHPSECSADPELRWRRSLLPGCSPGAAGTD